MENNKNLNTFKPTDANLYPLEIGSFDCEEYKTPYLYEVWNWEGDKSVLPNKWVNLISNSKIGENIDSNSIKDYLKSNYYNNIDFDENNFFFITNRSEVAGCCYLNKTKNSFEEIEFIIEYLIINLKKHANKGVEMALIRLAVQRLHQINDSNSIKLIYIDQSKSNINLQNMQF